MSEQNKLKDGLYELCYNVEGYGTAWMAIYYKDDIYEKYWSCDEHDYDDMIEFAEMMDIEVYCLKVKEDILGINVFSSGDLSEYIKNMK